MQPQSVYKKAYHIEISDVDFTKKLKLSTLFGYFQEIASEHAENLGLGFDTLIHKYGVTWILMRMRVEIIRNPLWNEEIVVETWPQEPKKLEFERDFYVRDIDGNIIIKGVSTWLMIDIKDRQIKKSDTIPVEYPPIRKERAIECKLGKIKASGALQTAYTKVVGYSDIDLNLHLNNSKYIDYITDCFSIESHQKYSVKSIEVSYLNEALPGDTLTLYKDVSSLGSNIVYIEGVNEQENKTIFKSQLEVKLKE